MWKSVENLPGSGMARSVSGRQPPSAVRGEPCASRQQLNACSACAGDYEDPDRTAWTPDPEEDEGEELPRERARERAEDREERNDEFPAREE